MNNTEYKIQFNRRVFERLQIPIIDLILMGKYYSFLLDSGSNGNVIDKEFFETLKQDNPELITVRENKSTILGLTNEEKVDVVELPLLIENQEIMFPFSIADLSSLRKKIRTKAGSEIEGILGSRFFDYVGWNLDFVEWAVWK